MSFVTAQVARLFVMVLLAAGGVWSGIKLHRMLRDRCQLTMFGYDRSQGADESTLRRRIESRRRRGRDRPLTNRSDAAAGIVLRRIAATPRPGRGSSADGSRRRGSSFDESRRRSDVTGSSPRRRYRNPLSSQDGAVFIVFMLVVLFWFIGLKLYNGLLSLCGQTQHRTDAGMPGWTYAAYRRPACKSKRAAAAPRLRRGYSVEMSRGAAEAETWIFCGDQGGYSAETKANPLRYNLALAGLLTWVSDVSPPAQDRRPRSGPSPRRRTRDADHRYLVATVADQMLQALALKRCAGYLAHFRRAELRKTGRGDAAASTGRGDAAASTWIFRGDESRRRRGRDVDILRRRVAATPRP